jgi:hypothetical protein
MARRFVFWSLPHRAYVAVPFAVLAGAYGLWIRRGLTKQDLPIIVAGWSVAVLLYIALVRVTLELRDAGLQIARVFGRRLVPLDAVRTAVLVGAALRVELTSGEVIEIRGDHWGFSTLAKNDDRYSIVEAHRTVNAVLQPDSATHRRPSPPG